MVRPPFRPRAPLEGIEVEVTMRITPFERRWADAVARALIPRGTLGVADDADVGALFAADCEEAPWHSGALLRLGLWMVWLAPLLRWRPRTFGRLSTSEREAVLEALLKSRNYVVRNAVLFVKLMVCTFVFGDARVFERLGAYRPPQRESLAQLPRQDQPPEEAQVQHRQAAP